MSLETALLRAPERRAPVVSLAMSTQELYDKAARRVLAVQLAVEFLGGASTGTAEEQDAVISFADRLERYIASGILGHA